MLSNMNILNGKEYDVIVCGAGSAGFCAAVQAARAGMKTAVVERYGIPGGVLTVMGNNIISQFNNPFRTSGKMVIKGIGWEFVEELSRMGYAHIPDMNAAYEVHWQYDVKVNPVAAAKLMDDYFIRENIDVYYNQQVVAVEVCPDGERNQIVSVIITTKEGLKRLSAQMFIDCTGDGDICAWAGAPYECGDKTTGELQPGTLRFYPKAAGMSDDESQKANLLLSAAVKEGRIMHSDLFTGDLQYVMQYLGDNLNHVSGFNSADSDSKTAAEMESRRSVLRVMDAFKAAGIHIEIISCAPEVAPRESRRILGEGYITCEDYINCKRHEDAICYSYWFIDLHHSGSEKSCIVYLKDGKTPTIPLSSMIPKGLSNVFAAGRCISGDRLANSAYRVKATCMAVGQAAGAAAAIAVQSNQSKSRNADLVQVKKLLTQNGAIVPGMKNHRNSMKYPI